MVKLRLILFFLFVSVLSFGQQVQFPNTYGIGYKRTGGDSLLWIPNDTISPISQLTGRRHIAMKGTTLYYWDGSKYSAISGGGGTIDTSNRFIWAQGNYSTMVRQTKNAWFDTTKLKHLKIATSDSAFMEGISGSPTPGAAVYEDGRVLNIRDIDSVTAANDDWVASINANAFFERITKLNPAKWTGYRGNVIAKQVYQGGLDAGTVYSVGGDLGYSLQGQIALSNRNAITSGRVLINGGTVLFDAVPATIGNITSLHNNSFSGTIRASGYWSPVVSYSNFGSGDSLDHMVYFSATGYDNGAKYLSKTGLAIPIDNNASRTALSWGVYSPDVTGGNSYNLFGGRVGIGDNFGTHTSPSFKSNAAFQINSTTRGFLPPRMTATQRAAISITAADSALFVFDLDSSRYMGVRNGAWRGLAWTGEASSAVGGSNNANVGSGYRWLKPGTQEIKTAFGGVGILIDSSSNTDGLTFKVDTFAIETRDRTLKIVDSLKSLGWGAQTVQYEPWYQVFEQIRQTDRGMFDYGSSGTGTATTVHTVSTSSPYIPGWIGVLELNTGTTNAGYAQMGFQRSGTLEPVFLDNSTRMNVGYKVRLEDLSDGTETFRVVSGFMDFSNAESNIIDGVWFSYTHGDSSGVWVCKTRSNAVTTASATSVTVAADTDYTLEISVFGGNAYFYINKTLVKTLSTNIPTGSGRETSINTSIFKSAGTTARKLYIDWGAYGTRSN